MKKRIKNTISFTLIFFFILFPISLSTSSETKKFLSLKNNEVNLRQGPSFEYPIKFLYKKKNLPIEILDKSGPWRKIRDLQKNSGWIHISQLSKKKSAINIRDNSIIYKKPTLFSKPIAKVKSGKLLIIKKCTKKWCKITANEYKGWILKNYLWGNIR